MRCVSVLISALLLVGRATSTWEVLGRAEDELARLTAAGSGDVPALVRAHTAIAETASLLRQYALAVSSRRIVESLLVAGGAHKPQELLLARVALADAEASSGNYTVALRVLQEARDAAVELSAPLPVLAGLSRAQAQVLDCSGDTAAALARFREGLPAAPSPWPQGSGLATPQDVRIAKDYATLLHRSGAVEQGALRVVEHELLAAGPWVRADQLPRTYVRGLAASPWHDAEREPALAPLRELLLASAPALRTEYRALRDGGALLPERECIAAEGGSWRYATVNAPWQRSVDADGCATNAPAACALLAAVRAQGVRGAELRATYSAVDAGAELRPHCGMTNTQLKLHLGLIVPRRRTAAVGADGAVSDAVVPCARLTVGGETRAWEEGEVLAFDDSFIHSVQVDSDCDAPEGRVVFQLVVPHPDVKSDAAAASAGQHFHVGD